MAEFHYSGQIRRFLIQFGKIFSTWQVTGGKDPNGNDVLVRIPVMYGNQSRQAATIIANNSASNLPSAPMITYYISGLEYEQKRLSNPTFVDKMQIRQRAYDPETQQYQTTQAQAFTLERLMPAPYKLSVTVDLWTNNEQQKQQFIEQLGILFNPALEIQSTDNFVDWTSLSAVFQESLNYSSRSVTQGTNNAIDILTWKFYMPIWITAPAKLKKMGVIHKVIASIFEGSTLYDIQDDDLLLGTRQKITPYGYNLLLLDNKLQLLPQNSAFFPGNTSIPEPENPDTNLYWSSLLNMYGAVKPGISQIWLQNPYMENDIVGTIVPDPLDDRYLLYDIDVDTLPQNTLDPISSIIDPLATGPNAGLEGPTPGKRYLILNNVGAAGNSTIAWGNLVANANDIIEYNADAAEWQVVFDSTQPLEETQFVTNLTNGIQYRFSSDELTWVKSYEGFYPGGDFSIVL